MFPRDAKTRSRPALVTRGRAQSLLYDSALAAVRLITIPMPACKRNRAVPEESPAGRSRRNGRA